MNPKANETEEREDWDWGEENDYDWGEDPCAGLDEEEEDEEEF